MFKMKYSISTVVLAGLLVVGVAACKKNYDQPAPSGDPGVVATISIKDLKTRYTAGAAVSIQDDQVIEGIVVCDDRSGNYYQQIAIQDPTGGILLRLGSANLYNTYPVGRKLFVKVKGLYLGQYNGTLQLGGGIDSAYLNQGGVTLLAYNLFDQHIIKGALNQSITPLEVSASQLTTTLQDRYISTLFGLLTWSLQVRIQLKRMQMRDNLAIELSRGVLRLPLIELHYALAITQILLM
jgi:hypothetical protein